MTATPGYPLSGGIVTCEVAFGASGIALRGTEGQLLVRINDHLATGVSVTTATDLPKPAPACTSERSPG